MRKNFSLGLHQQYRGRAKKICINNRAKAPAVRIQWQALRGGNGRLWIVSLLAVCLCNGIKRPDLSTAVRFCSSKHQICWTTGFRSRVLISQTCVNRFLMYNLKYYSAVFFFSATKTHACLNSTSALNNWKSFSVA